jgi:tRNA (guanine37-N1)-methyltransferase
MANYDIIGDIAIIKFRDETLKEKKLIAEKFLSEHRNIKTVLEKAEKVSGRLRTIKTKFLAGIDKKETLYHENNSRFKLNVDSCYFSPRLAAERLEIARLIANEIKKRKLKEAKILVMFSGVAPFSIVIAKNNPKVFIDSIELGKECCRYAKQNVILNKVENRVKIIQGDVKRIIKKIKEKYDIIVMPRPNLKETFFSEALGVSKKNSLIIYYGFCSESKKEEMIEELLKIAKKSKKKIKILNVKEAGDIAPYEHRYRVEILVQ